MTDSSRAENSIGPYDIQRVLGRGSMGMVFLARDRRIGRQVALKKVHFIDNPGADDTASVEFHRRLQREAEVCGALQHRNLVMLYEAGYEGERISYLAMEYVDGETLLAKIKRARPSPLPVDESLRIGADILRGLDYAHAKGIIHRDIKPANILVTGDGLAKIADFGIARPEQSSLTLAGSVMGTPNYMSPEQVMARPVNTRADIFSAGVILFEMLTGARPFMGENIDEILKRIVSWTPARVTDLNPSVPAHVSSMIERMMAKNPDDRPSAAEALSELDPSTRTEPIATASRPERQSPLRRRVSARTFLLTVVVAILALAIPVLALRARARRLQPVQHISESQLREFEEKRRALAEADMLRDNGRYEESIEKYNAYLARYPHSEAAEAGRQQAQAALDAQTTDPAKPTATVAKKRPAKKPLTPLERLRRFINR
jgi:serine/threonine protein kinase